MIDGECKSHCLRDNCRKSTKTWTTHYSPPFPSLGHSSLPTSLPPSTILPLPPSLLRRPNRRRRRKTRTYRRGSPRPLALVLGLARALA